jgi:filamentous hemagglutinin family protein
MTQTVTVTRRHSRCPALTRKALMMSCASAALASAALLPQSAQAQAFQGNITGTTGSVVRSTPTTTTETLTIGTNTATINWSPTSQQQGGGAIDFLPSGNTATFTSAAGVTDYTVLNRILPNSGQAIALNGHVISTLQGTSATGGHVWFYAPGGIVVGATAVFDVGGLLLTTNDVTSFGTTANGFNASFSGTPGSTSRIQVQSGAQINALQQNSYVALVAPRIEEGGKVRVDGTAAYVAGEQLAMTMNQGLFDIQVDVGTSDSNGVVHTGETTGPASPQFTDPHRVYMVAVPKNQALTMLLGGSVGFDDAVSADVQNGQIILSAGLSPQETGGTLQLTGSNSGNAGITFRPGTFSSDLRSSASGDILALADTGNISFSGDVTSLGSTTGDVTVGASNGFALNVGTDLRISSGNGASVSDLSLSADSGGTVNIHGNLTMVSGASADGSLGIIAVDADGGSISVGGRTTLDAGALTGSAASESDAHANTGGEVNVAAHNNGTISMGQLEIDASGAGQNTAGGGDGAGGDGSGGIVFVGADSGGRLTVNGNLAVNASGTGGAILDGGLNGGLGSGGAILLTANDATINVTGNATLHADGIGGGFRGEGTQASTSGGAGHGGSAFVETFGAGSLTVGGATAVSANATGGSAITAGGAQGGEINLSANFQNAEVPAGIAVHQLSLAANGTMGTGSSDGETVGSGGAVLVTGTGGSIAADSLSAQANGSSDGGFIDLVSNNGFGESGGGAGSLRFGTVNAVANGGDFAGNILVSTQSGSSVDLGEASLRASGAFGGSIDLFAGSCSECGGGDFAVHAAALPAGGGIAATDLTLDTPGNIVLSLGGGADISVAGTLRGDAGQSISLTDVGDGGAIRAHEIDLTSISIVDSADVIADIIRLTASSNLDLGTLSASDRMTLTAGGDLSTGDLTATNALTLESGGNIDTGDLSAHTVALTATAGTSVGDVHASGSATFTAGGLAAFGGTVNSPTISVTSGDIDIREGASLGVSGVTNLITLNAISHGLPIVIGDDGSTGDDAAGQYHLGNEDGDIRSAAIVVNAAGAAPGFNPDVNIFDLQIEGSATPGGGNGSVTLNTPGTVHVLGALNFINAATTDRLVISANQRIEVITPSGSIRMTDANGGLAGTLTLRSANIVATDAALAARLAADPNFSGRDEALKTNTGPINPAGYLQAGGIELLAGSNIFIQNTGTATDFAGLTVGGGGLLVGRFQAVTTPGGTQGFSFVGTLTTANDVLQFNFTVTAESDITLRTYSYAGGTNAQGQVIPAGGFDPILALFNAAGALINQNDDGGSNVPADPTTGAHFDTFLQSLLPPGTYTVTVMAYSNFANGPNLSDGFRNTGNLSGRSTNFAFDVLGASTATGPGGGPTGPINVVAFGRRQNADGTFTSGSAFFNQVNFGVNNGVEYAQDSSFNGCAIAGCAEPPPPPPPAPPPPVAPGVDMASILGPLDQANSPSDEDKKKDKDEGDEGDDGSKADPNLRLINTTPINLDHQIDDPVTSGGDVVVGGPVQPD